MVRALLAIFSIFCVLVVDSPASALTTDVLITHVQLGGNGAANQEFVAISNSSSNDINISDWCIEYADYSYTTISNLYCFEVSPLADEVHMSAKSSAVVVSHAYPLASSTSVTGLFKLASTAISGTRGHIVLLNSQNEIVDALAWDNNASSPPTKPETLAASAPLGGSMLQRTMEDTVYVDTNNNSVDFVITPSAIPVTAPLIDYVAPREVIDLCGTIEGIQEIMPEGYDFDEAGNCELTQLDQCTNIDRVQVNVPADLLQDNDKKCYEASLDVCTNMTGLQMEMPINYRPLGNSLCKQIAAKAPIRITEVLPNVSGIDTGKEFIELFNPSLIDVDLSDYYFRIGKELEKQVNLLEITIQPGKYAAFYDTELGLTFLNTTTKLQLVYYDGSVVDEIIPYEDPADDVAWAYIDSTWQYTNNNTPGYENKAATEILGEQNEIERSAPCPAGKYRNPLTNRCRNIEEDISVLGSCGADEYRNPETNRCRKIASTISTLAACEEGYERNPETNRCRKITVGAILGDCAEGYERNVDTNRCRKVLAQNSAAEQVADLSDINNPEKVTMYPLIATVATGGLAYGLYEWRTEARSLLRRLLEYLPKK